MTQPYVLRYKDG